MARNVRKLIREGVMCRPDVEYGCKKCKDKGYTWAMPALGLMTCCDACDRGRELAEKLEQVKTDMRTCRKFGREGVLTRV